MLNPMILIIIIIILIGITLLVSNTSKPSSSLGKITGKDNHLMNTIRLGQLSPNVKNQILKYSHPRDIHLRDGLVSGSTQLTNGSSLTTFDARVKWPGLITGPPNQLTCGSCWILASMTAISDKIRISSGGKYLMDIITDPMALAINGSMDNLSSHYLASCNDASGGATYPCPISLAPLDALNETACGGGLIHCAYSFFNQTGCIPLSCDYYQNYTCPSSTKILSTCSPYQKFKSSGLPIQLSINSLSSDDYTINMQTIQNSIYSGGTVTASYQVYKSFETFFNKPSNAKLVYQSLLVKDTPIGGHAIDIIGWGVDPTTPTGIKYWLCRNSWGTTWGDKGFFKILRGQNFCSIEEDVWTITPHLPPLFISS